MLPPNATPDQWHDFLKLLVKPFGANLKTIDCEECYTLIQGLLAGEVKTAEVCAHIHACQISQARLAIPVEIPIQIGVEA